MTTSCYLNIYYCKYTLDILLANLFIHIRYIQYILQYLLNIQVYTIRTAKFLVTKDLLK